MNKSILLVISLLLLSPALALDVTLKEKYDQKETIIAEIQGPVLEPITPSQVEFFRNNVQVVFEYDIKRIGSGYFIYAITPEFEQNYTLFLKDVLTTVNGNQQRVTLEKDFSTTNNTVPYTLNPGFIITAEDFDLVVTLNRDQSQDIAISNPQSTFNLQPGTNVLHFSLDNFPNGFSDLIIGMYTLPVYITKPITTAPGVIVSNYIRITPDRYSNRFIIGERPNIIFQITNTGKSDLTQFVFDYDSNIMVLNPKEIKKLKVNETLNINVTLKSFNQSINSLIKITAGNETFDLPLIINYDQENPIVTNNTLSNQTQPSRYRCSEYADGKICLSSQSCQGQIIQASDGECCRGTCVLKETKSSNAWIGYLIVAIILIVGVIILGRYFKSRGSLPSIFAKK